jgi:phosphatidate cytidylyltransferase
MHLKRWITSILVLPFLILLIAKGKPVHFAILIGAVCILTLGEYLSIAFAATQRRWTTNPIALLAMVAGIVIIFAAYHHLPLNVLGVMAFNLILIGALSLFQYKNWPLVVDVMYKQVLGVLYIPVFLSYLVMIRCEPSGKLWIFLLLCIVFSGDVGQYYFGTYLGKHKLCPAVSPGKTWEGSIGGLATNLVIGSILKYFFLTHLPWASCLFMFLFMGVAGQVGDLFESELKRRVNIKDSGKILPGHGGILDRIDALLFVAPVVYYYKLLILAPV